VFHTRSWHWVCPFCAMLSWVGEGLAMVRFPVQGVLPKCPIGFIVSEVNSDLEKLQSAVIKFFPMKFSSSSVASLLLSPNITLSTCPQTFPISDLTSVWKTKFHTHEWALPLSPQQIFNYRPEGRRKAGNPYKIWAQDY